MDMAKCNPVSTPGLQVTDKDLATEEQLFEVLAGLYRRVTGRLLYVADTSTSAQQAVKEVALGRSKRVSAYLVNKRISSGSSPQRSWELVTGKVVCMESCSDIPR